MKSNILLTISLIFCAAFGVSAQTAPSPFKTGDIAPDFTLAAHTGEQITLSEAVKSAPVVLVFYRGYWCPYCANQLSDLRGLLGENEKTRLLAVSVDAPEQSVKLVGKVEKDGKGKINYLLLSDRGAKTIDAYGLRDPRYNGEKTDGIPYPTIYIITKERKIVWAKLEKDYKNRPTNAEIRRELDKLK